MHQNKAGEDGDRWTDRVKERDGDVRSGAGSDRERPCELLARSGG